MQPLSCYSDILGNILRWHDILFYYYYMGRASSSSFFCPFYPILSCKVSFHSTKFSTDRGYATSIDMNIYLWKEDIEDGESVMTAEYRPVEYGKDYDVVNNPDKFQLYIGEKRLNSNFLKVSFWLDFQRKIIG